VWQKKKSIDILINAMPKILKNIPSLKFIIVGDGPTREELKVLSINLGVAESVVFAGAKPWDEIGKYYRMGDIFVCASTSETQGLTYIEAMAARVPVVAKSDKSIENLILHGETGFVFNDDTVADTITKALSDEQKRWEVAQRAWGSIQHLSSKHFGYNMASLYEEILNHDDKPRPHGRRRLRLKMKV
jgi:1,2-diacylglycerol 3-alpha-glucosyltransferase